MRYSTIFSHTSKEKAAQVTSTNAKLLIQAGFIDQQIAGVYSFLPLGLITLRKIEDIIREEMNVLGAHEILMPALSSLATWQKTERSAMDVLFHLKGADGQDLVLNPTHEEIVTPLVQKHVFSYRDLPVAVFQIQNKYRNEPRAKSGILRGREFSMKDLYSFHADAKDRDSYYELVKKAYQKIFERVGIGDKTFLTYASGGDFSKYSHEYQTVTPVGEDTIHLCENCGVAINQELIGEMSACPDCGSKKLTKKKAIEVGNIFKLGTRFSKAFGFSYTTRSGKKELVEMASYGIGPSRVMGTLVEVLHDQDGMIWPTSVAPAVVHLIDLGADAEIRQAAKSVYEQLKQKEIAVLWDDRAGVTAGAKLKDADLIGLPFRVVISKKTLEQKAAEVKARTASEPSMVLLDDLVRKLATRI